MANRTVSDAKTVKGTNPQYLVEKITRARIYESKYWKEQCFALSAELLVDKAMELDHIGGTFGGNIKPTPFLCLLLKMLQIQPEKEIIVEFIKNDDYKYVRALGAMYMRLVGTSLDCFNYLEPLFNDYRKLKKKNRNGVMEIVHMDEFIDNLLREERECDVILPRIQKRNILESTNTIEPRRSLLEDDLEDMESEEEEEEEPESPPHRRRSHSRSPEDLSRRKYRDHDRPRRRSRSPHRRSRSRSRSPRRRRRSPSPRRRRRTPSPHHRRHKSRSRSRSPRRRHSRSRSRSRSPRRRHRSRSRSNTPEKSSKHKKSKKDKSDKKEKKRHDDEGTSKESLEIKEANELRASLGLKPLK
ncbi:pre-mRNA-splicing factor 38A-like [Actinia tenebrosa]|uniref:Pre-mRNA-splicing factor 38 n=1 Tax=Actinia tenebrosa TaxID=6105 RepID=A0A6P8I0U5_ACTTE|nr:pre-mRNA-splicing factor 38A-like [Actinia tenebrosa]